VLIVYILNITCILIMLLFDLITGFWFFI